jgi:hypothetical protein
VGQILNFEPSRVVKIWTLVVKIWTLSLREPGVFGKGQNLDIGRFGGRGLLRAYESANLDIGGFGGRIRGRSARTIFVGGLGILLTKKGEWPVERCSPSSAVGGVFGLDVRESLFHRQVSPSGDGRCRVRSAGGCRSRRCCCWCCCRPALRCGGGVGSIARGERGCG